MDMDTLVEVLKTLQARGYTNDFSAEPLKSELQRHPEMFTVDKVYRFEGMTDPEDEAAVYAISSGAKNWKGILVNAFGVYADEWTTSILPKIKTGYMNTTNAIGLDYEISGQLSNKLNNLLTDYMVFYQNVRGFHWNIRGDKFFELHAKFEELYTSLLVKVDEIAERILTLGHTPLHSFDDYLQYAEVKPQKNITLAKDAIEGILSAFKTIIIRQREIYKLADEAGDEGTSAMMSDYVMQQEKLVWMYSAYLNEKS
jgi:starvation-inducible DNA-binding protein